MISLLLCLALRSSMDSSVSHALFPALLLLLWVLELAVTIYRFRKEKACRCSKKVLRILLAVCTVLEIAGCITMLLPHREVPLEFVGKYPTAHIMQSNVETDWDVLFFRDGTEPILSDLEQYYQTDFNGFNFETNKYSYLFVYGKKKVTLEYSMWDLELNITRPPRTWFFWGHLLSEDAQADSYLYVFRFHKAPILRYGIF